MQDGRELRDMLSSGVDRQISYTHTNMSNVNLLSLPPVGSSGSIETTQPNQKKPTRRTSHNVNSCSYHLRSSGIICKSLDSTFSFLRRLYRATRESTVQVFHLRLAAPLLSLFMLHPLQIEQSIAMRQGPMMHDFRFPQLFKNASCASTLKYQDISLS
jgi:hypothetical protein